MNERKMDWEIYRYGVCSDAGAVPVCCGKERAEPKGKVLDLQVDISSYQYDQKNNIRDTSCQNESPLGVGSILETG